MIGDFPRVLREHLERSRRLHRPFERAWTDALADLNPIDSDKPRSRDKRGTDQVNGWPLRWMKGIYRRAYEGLALTNVSIIERPACRDTRRVPVADGIPPERCHSGDDCARRPLAGERFCREHLAELHRIRGEMGRPGSRAFRDAGRKLAYGEDAA